MKLKANAAGTWRPLAAVVAVSAVLTLLPIVIAAALGSQGQSLETTRTITLGGATPAFEAKFEAPANWPDCNREFAESASARQYTCGDVRLVTRSASDVEDLPRFASRTMRANIFNDASMFTITPLQLPDAPGIIAWASDAIEMTDGNSYRVLVFGKEKQDDGKTSTSGISVVINGDTALVEESAAIIGKSITFGGKR